MLQILCFLGVSFLHVYSGGMTEPNLLPKPINLRGFKVYPSLLLPQAQTEMRDQIRAVVAQAPMFSPLTAWGKPMSVKMSAAGKYGWYSDRKGYRYEPKHPKGMVWPDIPNSVLSIWTMLTGLERQPDCCLINHYREGARMGMHQDRDEADLSQPVVSISLGDDALFRIGGSTRGGKTHSAWLSSGDVLVLGGAARLAYHGVDRLCFGSNDLLRENGRINLTLRVVRDAHT